MHNYGANCTVMNNLDAMVELDDIKPFTVRVPVNGGDAKTSHCKKQGFIPIPCMTVTFIINRRNIMPMPSIPSSHHRKFVMIAVVIL